MLLDYDEYQKSVEDAVLAIAGLAENEYAALQSDVRPDLIRSACKRIVYRLLHERGRRHPLATSDYVMLCRFEMGGPCPLFEVTCKEEQRERYGAFVEAANLVLQRAKLHPRCLSWTVPASDSLFA